MVITCAITRSARAGSPVISSVNVHRHDLPRHAEAVAQPAALLRALVAAFGQARPVTIDLVLVSAVDDERHGRRDLEHRAAVQRDKRLPVELERDGHHRALRAAGRVRAGLAVARDVHDARVVEYGHIETGRGLGVAVEPQERRDALDTRGHGVASSMSCRHRCRSYIVGAAPAHGGNPVRRTRTAARKKGGDRSPPWFPRAAAPCQNATNGCAPPLAVLSIPK